MKNKIDTILAAAVGIAALLILMAWPFEGLHPYVWNDTAVAADLRPQCVMLPGLGLYLAHLLFLVFPTGVALTLTVALAKVAMAVLVFLAYGFFKNALSAVALDGGRDKRRRLLSIRVASAVAAFLFGCSDPVGHAAQGVTGSGFVLVLIVVSAYLFAKFIRTARPALSYAALAVTGVLTAENPLGWVVLACGLFFSVRVALSEETLSDEWRAFLNPARMQHVKWTLTFTFIGAFVVTVLLEMAGFVLLDGLRVNGITAGSLPTAYADAYGDLVAQACNLPGFCLLMIFVIMPILLVRVMIGVAADEDRYLTFKVALIYIVCGSLAFLQVSPFDVCWFWQMTEGVRLSRVLTLAASFLSALTLAWAFFVLCVEIFCRNYRYIQNMVTHRESDDDPVEIATGDIVSVRLTVGRLALLVLPLACVVVAAYGRRLPEDRHLNSLMQAVIRETVDEATGLRQLFTDGSYDAAVRLEALRRGMPFATVSFMSDTSQRDTYLRQQAAQGEEDRLTLAAGASTALKTWVVSKSDRLDNVAVQLAFELFRLNRRLSPVVYGLMVRPQKGDPKAAADSFERCHALADAIVAAHESGTWRHAKDRQLKDRFLFGQFRLAVMSRLRAIQLDSVKNVSASLAEISYSDRLNANNPSLRRILRKMDWVSRMSGEALTPREGLELAMKRADFMMARRYALPILRDDPDDAPANFAVGMSYYAEEQFAKAEEYLKRCLKKAPQEPAVLNNIALICLKTDRLKEAEENALRAQKLAPDVPEIKDTLRQIDEAKAKKVRPEDRFKR